jgi:hypothetical protein
MLNLAYTPQYLRAIIHHSSLLAKSSDLPGIGVNMGYSSSVYIIIVYTFSKNIFPSSRTVSAKGGRLFGKVKFIPFLF